MELFQPAGPSVAVIYTLVDAVTNVTGYVLIPFCNVSVDGCVSYKSLVSSQTSGIPPAVTRLKYVSIRLTVVVNCIPAV